MSALPVSVVQPLTPNILTLTVSQDLSDASGKDFNFLKQHFLKHARHAFMSKGTSRNMNTRVGEGFQQEVAKMYEKTNGKNAEHQVGMAL